MAHEIIPAAGFAIPLCHLTEDHDDLMNTVLTSISTTTGSRTRRLKARLIRLILSITHRRFNCRPQSGRMDSNFPIPPTLNDIKVWELPAW